MSNDMANAPGAEIEAPAEPIAASERFAAVDTLRGVAVLGILVMNIYMFAMPIAAYMDPLRAGGTEWYNLGTWYVSHILFDQKFMTIFSLLFGGGLVMMWERARARSIGFARIFFRRQVWLLVIGALHAYLIWFGDILFQYAVAGMLAYFFRKRSPRTLIVIGVLFLSVTPLLSYGSGVYIAKMAAEAELIEARRDRGEAITDYQQAMLEEWATFQTFIVSSDANIQGEIDAYRGSYVDTLRHRAPIVVAMQTDNLLYFFLWRIWGLMLIGMALMKLGILSGQRDLRFYNRMLVAGYSIGIPIAAFSAYLLTAIRWDPLVTFRVGQLPNYFGSVFMAFGHIAAVMLIVKKDRLIRLMARFAAVGRMALTNYLLHSIVMTTIFYGYGLGLYGQVPRSAQMLFVAAMLGLQLWLSPLWLERFRFGPFEWLWRSLTYWRMQPMRRHAA